MHKNSVYFIILINLLNLLLINCIRYGSQPDYLYVNQDNEKSEQRQPQLIKKSIQLDNKDENLILNRNKRNSPTPTPSIENENSKLPNITVKVNSLNDSHAQLMVHWLGDGSDVMICLARDPPLGPLEDPKRVTELSPSSVYFSYNYGETFENKTSLFTVKINGTDRIAQLDQFLTHPKFDTIIFTDSRNKVIFNVPDHGDNIQRYTVDFTPSDISFYENDAKTFLALDKEDPDRRLYYTTDAGYTFTLLQTYVKSFSWSSGENMPVHLYVERKEPITNTSSVIFMNAADLLISNSKKEFNLLIENVQDFHIKKDFMFVTKKVINTTQLWISFKRGRFVKADFQTELDIKGMHIPDVEGRRIMVSAAHSDIISHLYVSETNSDMTDIKFVPSIENIFTYIPEIMWKQGWLAQTTDEAFTDLYKVEGIRGIYIASKVNRSPTTRLAGPSSSIGPEHLVSVISFDHGASWRPITAPQTDDEGQPINCTKDCSLHLSQKFSQIYPVTRAVSIMSSKLAPGVIMASGVIGKSIKGHPGVFLSRDAGMTWTQVLKTYHFFNFGDHGGVLIAVKYYKSKGETRHIIYSTDEGENWQQYPFHDTDLKVYGLMTEPNSNTTIFTLFGSEFKEHQWLIIKIDLKNAFTYNCTADDYKFWAPSSQTGESLMPCQLGKQQTFQRRIPHANCFNGKDYVPASKTEICLCNSWDFECDFGFTRLNANSPCRFNKSMQTIVDPYKIPNHCSAGSYYNRTRGYRKIEGDVCVGGFESRYLPYTFACPLEQTNTFLLVAQRDRISRIDLTTLTKEELPIPDLKNVIAFDFDMKHNCVFFADIMSDKIGRQCLDGNHTTEILIDTDLASVEGMSYDWISELLFFVDGTRSKIGAVKTSRDSLSRMRTTIIDSKHIVKPRGIVVHPIEGLLFWTEWSTQKPSLSRSNLDGTDIKVLFTKPEVIWPNGVTIDYFAQRVYWVDASKDYIGSCDLNGKGFVKILEQDSRVAHPFGVAIYKDLMYWDDWKMNSIFSADKDHGIMIKNVVEQMNHLMDLKIYAHSIQEGGNGCLKHNCSHICVGMPKGGFTCLCPDGMQKNGNECLCPGGLKPFANNTCIQQANTCGPGFFTCETNKLCIPLLHRCDGDNDCGDFSDEKNCSVSNVSCPPRMFTCKSDSKCIPEYFACDFDIDCDDASDEADCKFNECKADEFRCKNGRCISNRWKCDREDDCRDGSDEADCKHINKTAVTCKSDEFRCTSNHQCIPNLWKCDTDYDCPDGSDESHCDHKDCDLWEFNCGDGKCIYRTWKCDGDKDCENGADEENCTTLSPPNTGSNFFPSVVCHDWMFKCSNNKCIPMWWKCDKVNDCGDDSDELGCSDTRISTSSSKPNMNGNEKSKCSMVQYQCNSGTCISKRYVCDGTNDCPDGEDEKNCPMHTKEVCERDQFRCASDRTCLPLSKYCDGKTHCSDGSDEEDCNHHWTPSPDREIKCGPAYFHCDQECMPLMKRCDKKMDCYDGSDEENCDPKKLRSYYQAINLQFETKFLEAKSFVLKWYVPPVPGEHVELEYLPSHSEVETNVWINHTDWISDTKFTFTGLNPYTNYNCTVYVRQKDNINSVTPPFAFANITTAEGVPSEPTNVNVTQYGPHVKVTWDPPNKSYGKLIAYTINYRDQSTTGGSTQNVKVSAQERSIVLETNFKTNVTYDFWIRAKNSKAESSPSKMVNLTISDLSNIDLLSHLTYVTKNNYLKLEWVTVPNAEGYYVDVQTPAQHPKIERRQTNLTNIEFKNLAANVPYIIKVSAHNKQRIGRPKAIKVILKGDELPEVRYVLVQDSIVTKVKWTKPKTNLNNITYGIYYGTSINELLAKPRIITKALSANITDLMPCEKYFISVGIVGPIGPGPLSADPNVFNTETNDRAPPRNLMAYIDSTSRRMTIKWNHSCPLYDNYTSFSIVVTELIKNKTDTYRLKESANKTYTHYFDDIPFGSIYNISVFANVEKAIPASIIVSASKLEGPRQLKVWPERNGTFVVYWKELEHPYNFDYIYEIVIFEGIWRNSSDDNVTVVNNITGKTPPILINPDHLGGPKSVGKIFTFGIRLKTSAGYVSEISETELSEMIPDASWSIVNNSTSYTWLIIIPIALIVSLIGIVFYLIQRHKRLQNSFSRFANSHYDTKTGATRIGTDVFDDDSNHHQEVPRFADDEPLVI